MDISEDVLRLVLYGRYKRSPSTVLKQTAVGGGLVKSPRQVCVLPSTLPGAHLGVFCCIPIKQGTEMGPFIGHVISKTEVDSTRHNAAMWELFDAAGEVVGFVNGDMRHSSWLSYVQCARSEREQNLQIVQDGHSIFYQATKDIDIGEELLVWYGHAHSLYMGVPSFSNQQSLKQEQGQCSKESGSEGESSSVGFTENKLRCVVCRRAFNSRSNLRSHMRIHTMEKPFVCKFCGRRFSQSSTLRNHVRLHTGEKPYKCSVCRSSYSQLAGLRAHQRSSTHRSPVPHTHTDGQT